ISDERPGLPPISNAAIPLDLVEGSTMGQLDLWRIIQSDLELGEGLNALVSTDSPLTPVHGDLRTDQIFYSNNDIWIIDWEDFHLGDPARDLDRKSTRLNSSHVSISYAVFCLKKNKYKNNRVT